MTVCSLNLLSDQLLQFENKFTEIDKKIVERAKESHLVLNKEFQISKKIYANLILNSLNRNTGYEGLSPWEYGNFLASFLRFYKKREFDFIPQKLLSKIESFITVLQKPFPKDLSQQAEEDLKEIKKLKEGQKKILLGGYSNYPCGHFSVIEIERNKNQTFNIYLFDNFLKASDRQQGIQLGGKTKNQPVKFFEGIPEEKLFFGSEDTLWIRLIYYLNRPIGKSEANENLKYYLPHQRIFHHIKYYETSLPVEDFLFLSCRKSGDCLVNNTHLYLRFREDQKTWKIFEGWLRLFAFAAFNENYRIQFSSYPELAVMAYEGSKILLQDQEKKEFKKLFPSLAKLTVGTAVRALGIVKPKIERSLESLSPSVFFHNVFETESSYEKIFKRIQYLKGSYFNSPLDPIKISASTYLNALQEPPVGYQDTMAFFKKIQILFKEEVNADLKLAITNTNLRKISFYSFQKSLAEVEIDQLKAGLLQIKKLIAMYAQVKNERFNSLGSTQNLLTLTSLIHLYELIFLQIDQKLYAFVKDQRAFPLRNILQRIQDNPSFSMNQKDKEQLVKLGKVISSSRDSFYKFNSDSLNINPNLFEFSPEIIAYVNFLKNKKNKILRDALWKRLSKEIRQSLIDTEEFPYSENQKLAFFLYLHLTKTELPSRNRGKTVKVFLKNYTEFGHFEFYRQVKQDLIDFLVTVEQRGSLLEVEPKASTVVKKNKKNAYAIEFYGTYLGSNSKAKVSSGKYWFSVASSALRYNKEIVPYQNYLQGEVCENQILETTQKPPQKIPLKENNEKFVLASPSVIRQTTLFSGEGASIFIFLNQLFRHVDTIECEKKFGILIIGLTKGKKALWEVANLYPQSWNYFENVFQQLMHKFFLSKKERRFSPIQVGNLLILSYFIMESFHSRSLSLKKSKSLFDSYALNQIFLKTKDHKRLILPLLLYILSQKTFQTEDWVLFFSLWGEVYRNNLLTQIGGSLDNYSLQGEVVEKGLERFQIFKNTLKDLEDKYEIMDQLIELEGLKEEGPFQWDFSSFPLVKGVTSRGKIWFFEILNGDLRNETGSIKEINTFNLSSFTKERLNIKDTLNVRNIGKIFYFETEELGTLEYHGNQFYHGNQLYRVIEGRKYAYISPSLLKDLFSLNVAYFFTDFSHWIDEELKEVIFCDLSTGKKTYRFTKENFINLNKKETEIHIPLKQNQKDSFLPIETDFYFEVNSNGKQLIYPYLHFYSKPLAFKLNIQGTFEMDEFPGFAAIKLPHVSPFGEFKDAICLKNKKEEFHFLVPSLSFKSKEGYSMTSSLSYKKPEISSSKNPKVKMYLYSFSYGQLEAAGNEEALFLSLIFLSQRRYRKAVESLKQIQENYLIGVEGSNHLETLFLSNNVFKDSSPNACAVALKGLEMVLKAEPFFVFEEILAEVLRVYEFYLESYGKVDEDLYLSKNGEKRILDFLQKKQNSLTPLIENRKAWILEEKLVEKSFSLAPCNESNLWEDADFPPISFEEGNLPGEIKSLLPEKRVFEMVPFEKYPLNFFVSHYNFLRDPKIDDSQKQKLIFLLGLTKEALPRIFKIKNEDNPLFLLKFAYFFQKEAPLLDIKNKEISTVLLKDIFPAYQLKVCPTEGELFQNRTFNSAQKDLLNSCKSKIIKKKEVGTINLRDYIEDLSLNFDELRKILCVEKKKSEQSAPYDVSYLNLCNIEIDKEDQFAEKLIKEYASAVEQEMKQYCGELQNKILFPSSEVFEASIKLIEENLNKAKKVSVDLKKLILLEAERERKARYGSLDHFLKKEGGKLKTLDFFDLLGAYASIDFEKRFQALLPCFNEDDLKNFLASIEIFLTLSTQVATLKKILKNLQKIKGKKGDFETSWLEAVKELSKDRTYSFEENRPRIVFEYLSGMRVREDQALILKYSVETLFEKGMGGVVFALMMGGGKTSVILAQLAALASEKDSPALIFCDASQYASVAGFYKKSQFKRFQQKVIPIGEESLAFLSGDKAKEIEFLEYLLEQIKKAKTKKRVIIVKTNFILFLRLELNAVSFGMDGSQDQKDPLLERKCSLLSEILDHGGTGFFDELDLTQDIFKGVHIAFGELEHISRHYIQLIKMCYQFFRENKEVKALLGLHLNEQKSLKESQFRTQIAPNLLDFLVDNSEELRIPQSHKKGFLKFALGEINPKLEERFFKGTLKKDELKSEEARFLDFLHHDLAKGNAKNYQSAQLVASCNYLICEIFPLAFSMSYNKDYGRLGTSIVPFIGSRTPSPTKFVCWMLEICLHFQTALFAGVLEDQVKNYAKFLTEECDRQLEKNEELSFNEVLQAKVFEEQAKVPLDQIENPETLRKALKNINKNWRKVLEQEAKTVEQTVVCNQEILSAFTIEAPESLDKVVGCAGILPQKLTFHPKFREQVLPNPPVQGKVMLEWAKKVEDGKSLVFTVPSEDIKNILEKSAKTRKDFSRVCAVVDVGSFFWEQESVKAAEKILNFYDKRLEPIKGVVFFYKGKDPDNSNIEVESFALLKKEGKKTTELRLLENLSKKEFKKYGLKKEEIFYLLDDLRSTGTDVLARLDGVFLVTWHPAQNDVRDLAQGFGRARLFPNPQIVDLVILEKTVHLLHHQKITPESVIKRSIRNGAIKQAKRFLPFFKESIFLIFYSHLFKVRQDLIRSCSKEESLGKFNLSSFMEIFRPFFVKVLCNDMYLLHGRLQKEEKIEKPLEAYFNALLEDYAKGVQKAKKLGFNKGKNGKILFTSAKKAQIQEECKKVIQEAKNLEFYVQAKISDSHENDHVQIISQQQIHGQIHENSTLNLSQEAQEELQLYQKGNLKLTSEFQDSWFNEFVENIQKFKKCPENSPFSLSFERGFIETGKGLPKPFNEKYQKFGKIFPSGLHLSKNFLFPVKQKLTLFHSLFDRMDIALGVFDKNKRIHLIVLSYHESGSILEKIYQLRRAFLISSEGEFIFGNPVLCSEEIQEVNKLVWFLNFLKGNISYLLKYEEETQNYFGLYSLEEERNYLELKSFSNGSYEIMRSHPIFYPEEFPENFSESLAEKILGQERVKELRNYSQKNDLAKLGPHELYFIPVELIPYLPDFQIRALPPKMGKNVPPEKIHLLNKKHISFFETVDQIKTLAEAKPEWIRCLGLGSQGKKQLELLPDDYIKDISLDAVENIPSEKVPLLPETLLGGLNQNQFPFLSSQQIPLLPHFLVSQLDSSEIIPYLTPQQIPALKNLEAIISLKPENARYLTRNQWLELAKYNGFINSILPFWRILPLKKDQDLEFQMTKEEYISKMHLSQVQLLSEEDLDLIPDKTQVFKGIPFEKYFTYIRDFPHLAPLILPEDLKGKDFPKEFIKYIPSENISLLGSIKHYLWIDSKKGAYLTSQQWKVIAKTQFWEPEENQAWKKLFDELPWFGSQEGSTYSKEEFIHDCESSKISFFDDISLLFVPHTHFMTLLKKEKKEAFKKARPFIESLEKGELEVKNIAFIGFQYLEEGEFKNIEAAIEKNLKEIFSRKDFEKDLSLITNPAVLAKTPKPFVPKLALWQTKNVAITPTNKMSDSYYTVYQNSPPENKYFLQMSLDQLQEAETRFMKQKENLNGKDNRT